MAETDKAPEQGYFVSKISKNSKGEDVLHLAKFPEEADDKASMQATLKRLAKLKEMGPVRSYLEIDAKPHFQRSVEDKEEFGILQKDAAVDEFLSLNSLRRLTIGDSAIITAPKGNYKVGDAISKNAAEKESGFKATEPNVFVPFSSIRRKYK
jgi:hypothetical protein